MITPILEKYLFNGKAKNKIAYFSFGSFTRIDVPDNSFIVVHKIFYTPFLNQKLEDITQMTWRDFFRYNEYQFKVQSPKDSPTFYIFRNPVDFTFFNSDPTNPIDLSANISIDQYNRYILMQPKKPIIFDCFFSSYEYFNFTLTRNSAVNIGVPAFAPVNNYANETPPPSGIDGQSVLLEAILTGVGTTDYQPPTNKISGQAAPSNMVQIYKQHIDGQDGLGDNWSMLNNPDAATGTKLPKSEFVTNPLIGIEYCVIQLNEAGKLSPL